MISDTKFLNTFNSSTLNAFLKSKLRSVQLFPTNQNKKIHIPSTNKFGIFIRSSMVFIIRSSTVFSVHSSTVFLN